MFLDCSYTVQLLFSAKGKLFIHELLQQIQYIVSQYTENFLLFLFEVFLFSSVNATFENFIFKTPAHGFNTREK